MTSWLESLKRRAPKEGSDEHLGLVFSLFGISLVFSLLAQFLPLPKADVTKRQMLLASEMMAEATETLRGCRLGLGLDIDPRVDPNRTGLIGVEFSEMTTSMGNLEAKRTTTNPSFAGLIVLLLREAGVREGDTIAIGASGSFPGLILATLAAARAMEVRPLGIYSLGASQWGANDPAFHWLHMQDCLEADGVLDAGAIAVSLGGDSDTGEDMSLEMRSRLEVDIGRSKGFFLREPNLERNVEARLKLYLEHSGGGEIQAFVQIGGAWANLGESPETLQLEPGAAELVSLPPREERGVLHGMAERGVPAIHLLFVKGLADRYALPWDPMPMPEPASAPFYRRAKERQPLYRLMVLGYLLTVVAVVTTYKLRSLRDRF